MNNHVHFLAASGYDFSLAQGIGRTNLIYTQYVNKKYDRSGRLWQNRFFSFPVDKEQYLWSVARYIETNPVRASLVRKPWDYQWSSARHHIQVYDLLGKRVKTLLSANIEKGEHLITWDKTDYSNRKVASGVYYVTIEKESRPEGLKVIIR